jgi:peptide/nickel transport system ATP-binding protein
MRMAGSGVAHLRDDEGDVVLRVEHLVVEFPHGRNERVHAVSDVSFDLRRGETLGLVGESGCGKSTLGRAVMQLVRPTAGSVCLDGNELTELDGSPLRKARATLQIIFQDPISSLNPTRRIGRSVAEGLEIQGRGDRAERTEKVREVLEAVGLDPDHAMNRYPSEFSGGQCQRICIARALVLEPEIVICDEPVSALDVSVQAQIINLLQDMKARYSLTLVFIAHDLAVVKSISDRIAVMYLGKLCEIGSANEVVDQPLHPYTAALLDSVPNADPEVTIDSQELTGELPSPMHPPEGCRFNTRCPRADERCSVEEPVIREIGRGHFVACHHPLVEPEVEDVVEVEVAVAVGGARVTIEEPT